MTKNTVHVEPTDINRSLSSLSLREPSLDNIIRKCGDFGRFQYIHYFFMNLIAMSAGIVGFYYVFSAAEPEHRCRLPIDIWSDDKQYNSINQTHELYLNRYIPKTKDEKSWQKCLFSKNNTLINCPNGWIYDRSIFGYTFTEEANFVCQNESRKSWLATAVQCGGFSLLIIGSLADKYGRKQMILIVTIFLFFTCLITQIIMQWVSMTVETKFFLLLINQFASGLILSIYSLVFILMLELTSVAQTSFVGNLAFVSYTLGEVFVTLFAYVTRDWQRLKWANTIFIGLGIPYLYFMPESPLYVYAKGQYDRLELILRRIARKNKRHEADWHPAYQELIRNQPIKLCDKTNRTFIQGSIRLLLHRSIIFKLLITSLIGFTTLMLYIKISYGLVMFNVSPYIAILIGAIVEATSYITTSVLISSRLGRKRSFILMMSLTIFCTLLIPMTLEYSSFSTIILAQFGKYAISSATAIAWIFVPELFPTRIRTTANGFFIAFSRTGAIVAPIMHTSVKNEYLSYTFYVSAILAMIVLLFSLILPETKDKPMDDSLNITDV